MNNKVRPLHKVPPSRLRKVAVLTNTEKPAQRVMENGGICSRLTDKIEPQKRP